MKNLKNGQIVQLPLSEARKMEWVIATIYVTRRPDTTDRGVVQHDNRYSSSGKPETTGHKCCRMEHSDRRHMVQM